jgi:hypothetical protein
MGAVNIANILYVFTGKYPIYILEESDDEGTLLRAYLFAKDDPTYSELVVTGHNLLENDYDNTYYGPAIPPETIGILDAESEENFVIKDGTISPTIPYAKDGTLSFLMSYDYQQNLSKDFIYDAELQTPSTLNSVTLTNVQYRPAGVGASDIEFKDISLLDIDANSLNNVPDEINENINILSEPLVGSTGNLIENIAIDTATNLDVTENDVFTVYETYWEESDLPQLGSISIQNTGRELFSLNTKELELTIDDFPPEYLVEGNVLSFRMYDENGKIILLEEKLQRAREQIGPWALQDSRILNFVPEVDLKVTGTSLNQTTYSLYYYAKGPVTKQDNILLEEYSGRILLYRRVVSTPAFDDEGNRPDAGTMSYRTTANGIYALLYDPEGNLLYEDKIYYFDEQANKRELSRTLLQQIIAMNSTDRRSFRNQVSRINRGSIAELYYHPNAGDDGIFIGAFRLGVDREISYNEGIYSFEVPAGVIQQGANHYSWKFKAVDVDTTVDQTNVSNYLKNKNTTIDDQAFFPNVLQLSQVSPYAYEDIDDNTKTYTIYNILDILDLQQQDPIGGAFLSATITNALLSGTYDFKFIYRVGQDVLDYANSQVVQTTATQQTVSYIFKSINITEEKLTDYEFFEDEDGNAKHPIWSCNSVIEHFNKLMVWGSEEMPTSLFYSVPDRPFYFPSFFYLDFTNEENVPLTSVVSYMNILVVQNENQTWGVRGNSGLVDAPSPYVQFTINPTVGAVAPKSVRPVRNQLFFLSKQGIIALRSLYAVDESYNIDFVDRNIRNIVPQDTDAVAIQFDNQYWLNFPNYGITLRWYIDKKAWVLDRFGGYRSSFTGELIDKEGAWNEFNGVFKYQIKDGKLEYITKPSQFSDENLSVYKVGVDYSLPTDFSGNIVARFETSYLNQNYPFHPKNYKETKLDFTIQNEYNLSKEAVYTMDGNEDMPTDFLHIVDNAEVLPNHFYRMTYDFTPYSESLDGGTFTEPNEDIYDGGDFTTNTYVVVGGMLFGNLITYDGGDFGTAPSDTLDGGIFATNEFPVISIGFALEPEINETFDHLSVDSIVVRDFENDTEYQVNNLEFVDNYVQFQVPNTVRGGLVDLHIEGNFINYLNGADLYDVTYDDRLTFKTWVISEEQTLNLDNITSYDQSKADLDFDLNSRLGTWVFGTSDFGNKITAVKTIKLSGRGYNSKIYMEDYSKSKWTLESIGITYKMKRARSR